MVGTKLPKINWIAVGAIATVVAAVATVVTYIWGSPNSIINSLADPPALTATIESFPYRHAETKFSEREKELREKWLQPLEDRLKKDGIAPELLETVVAAMDDMIDDEILREVHPAFPRLERSEKWYSVTIRNDGDKPLKNVFLKFPAADYWIDERRRLAFVPQRIEIGNMDQKSEERYTFWGRDLGYFFPKDEVVLGHSNGLGTIEFE